jgi:hypothetical protein
MSGAFCDREVGVAQGEIHKYIVCSQPVSKEPIGKVRIDGVVHCKVDGHTAHVQISFVFPNAFG